jgi:putative membrane protein
MRMLLNWLISAVSLLIVAYFVRGFVVSSFLAVLIAAVVIGFINATLGAFLKIVTFPLTVVTFGIFWLIINALMLLVASAITPGFHIVGFGPAFWGAIVLAIVQTVLGWLARKVTDNRPG